MSDAKAKIRKGTLFNRRMLKPKVWASRCEQVTELAFNFVIERNISCVHLFLPISKNKEVDTWPLLKRLSHSEIRTIISETDFKSYQMKHYWYSETLQFEEDTMGIPTPKNAEAADFREAELVFVPLLAADKIGNRVGYGKGFYDQLLHEAPDMIKVGLSLAPLFDQFGFLEAHDVRLDYCITPNQIHNCHEH